MTSGWGSEHPKTGISHCFTITGAPFCGDPRVKASGELSQDERGRPCKLCVFYRSWFAMPDHHLSADMKNRKALAMEGAER